MNKMSLLLAGVMTLSGAFVASAKSYNISLDNPSQAGSTLLPAGDYNVKIQGSDAVFQAANSNKRFTAPVKIENDSRKHQATAVELTKQNGTDRIQAIELKGSTETLKFNN